MGSCQTNILCTQEIKSKMETQTIINELNYKEVIIKDKKNSFMDEPRVFNEKIKIAIPIRSFSSTKISNRNL